MAITKISNSSLKNLNKYDSFLAGNDPYDPGATYLIERQTIGAGGAASVEFTSIPSTYTHLQVRILGQTNRATYPLSSIYFQVGNGTIDTGSNYSSHAMFGDGSTAYGNETYSNATYIGTAGSIGTSTGGTFSGSILDILDYANTNKYKTTRMISGFDVNGTVAGFGGRVAFCSGNWRSNSAINRIKFYSPDGNFTQYSSFALYGIKG
jgi:hypothetical protein